MKEKFNSKTFQHSLWRPSEQPCEVLEMKTCLMYQKPCVQVQYLLFKWPEKTEERNFEPNGAAGFLKTGLQKNT